MTYETVIQRLRFRMRDIRDVPLLYHEDGALFTIVNEAARELYRKTRDFEKTADLTIVASQYDYDIASEIAVDVGDIYQIVMLTGQNSLGGRGLLPFNTLVLNGTAADAAIENSDVTAKPEYFRVWQNTLRIYPTPLTDDAATVYYFAKEPLIDYSNANMTLQIRLGEEYLESLLTYAKGVVYEIAGNESLADKKKGNAFSMIDEVKAGRVSYDYSVIPYDGGI